MLSCGGNSDLLREVQLCSCVLMLVLVWSFGDGDAGVSSSCSPVVDAEVASPIVAISSILGSSSSASSEKHEILIAKTEAEEVGHAS